MVKKGKLTAHPQIQTAVAKKTLMKNGSEVEYHKEDDDDDMEDNSRLRRALMAVEARLTAQYRNF